jgi:hypothetical protein
MGVTAGNGQRVLLHTRAPAHGGATARTGE